MHNDIDNMRAEYQAFQEGNFGSLDFLQKPCCTPFIKPNPIEIAIADMQLTMVDLLREINWYFENRKDYILPVKYEDMLKYAVSTIFEGGEVQKVKDILKELEATHSHLDFAKAKNAEVLLA